jgi:hypothetical protein
MAKDVLALVGELSRCHHGVLIRMEGGVIAKAALAPRPVGKTTGPTALEDALDTTHGIDVCQRADVGERTASGRLGKELGEVLLIGGVNARIASGIHPGSAAKCLSLDARVIRDADATGGGGGRTCLVECIRLERVAGLRRERDIVGQGIHDETWKQPGELAALVVVARGEEQRGGICRVLRGEWIARSLRHNSLSEVA